MEINTYCKVCLEACVGVLMSAVAEPSLVPKGRPSKALFIVGAVGCIINTIAAISFLLGTLVRYSLSYWTVVLFLLMVGLSLASVGYLGTRRNYGSGVGTASFAVAVVVSILFLLWDVWHIIDYEYFHVISERLWYIIFGAIYELFFVTMILWGITHITTRRFTGKSGLSLATGIMLILTAVFVEIWTTLFFVEIIDSLMFWEIIRARPWEIIRIFDLIWESLFFVSQILATTLFFIAKVPELPAKPAT